MAFRTLNQFVDAISIGNPKEKRDGKPFTKKAEGYLITAVYNIGKTKKKKGSTKYSFQSKKGEKFDVWGNASINSALCENDKIISDLLGKFVRVEYIETRPGKKGHNPQRVCDIKVDDDDKLNVSKSRKTIDYTIKKA